MTEYRKQTVSVKRYLNDYFSLGQRVDLFDVEVQDIFESDCSDGEVLIVFVDNQSRIDILEPVNEFRVGQVYEFDGQRTVITASPDEDGWISFTPPLGTSDSAWVNSDLAKNMKLVLDVEE